MGTVSQHVADPGELRGFDPSAARSVALAEREARELGHDRIGTEHLLLGLLTNASETSAALTDAGVTLTAARGKVREAVGSSSGIATPATGPLPRTARAHRALGRAARFAHAEGSDVITSDHVLCGLLDVEGTAGQVLRGLGVDVESLRHASSETLETDRGVDTRERADTAASPAKCPSCSVALEENLASRVVGATTDSGAALDAIVFSCASCGQVLGVAPA